MVKETKQEEKNRLRNQMRDEVLEPEHCEDKYNINLFGRKIDLDYQERVQVSIPVRLDHWLRNWAKNHKQLVSKRLELFLQWEGLNKVLSHERDRHKESDAHAIRWHYHNSSRNKKKDKPGAIYSLCKIYRQKVSDEIKDEYLRFFPSDPLGLFEDVA